MIHLDIIFATELQVQKHVTQIGTELTAPYIVKNKMMFLAIIRVIKQMVQKYVI
jgi:hypothetical protein